MKKIAFLLAALALAAYTGACHGATHSLPRESGRRPLASPTTTKLEAKDMASLSLEAGGQTFVVTLDDNPSAKALLALLPLDLQMSEMNGNEKYFFLPERLPSAGEPVEEIQEGDLMLYGDDCLVLFYKTFSTSYSYTPLGHIDHPDGLAQALGSGDAQIKFYRQE